MKEVPTNRKPGVINLGRGLKVKQNLFDRVVGYFSPVKAARRLRSRAVMALVGGYGGASKSRRGLKQWSPFGYDADSDILPDLSTLRERSRDLIRNNPLAAGAINTKATSIVGGALNLTEEQADAWEAATEREWSLFWDSKECDAARTLTGNAITKMIYRQAKEKSRRLISALPLGKRLWRASRQFESGFKGLFMPTMLWEELGFTYARVDEMLYLLVDQRYSPEALVNAGFELEFVQQVITRVRRYQFKRKLPPVARVSNRANDLDFLSLRDWGI